MDAMSFKPMEKNNHNIYERHLEAVRSSANYFLYEYFDENVIDGIGIDEIKSSYNGIFEALQSSNQEKYFSNIRLLSYSVDKYNGIIIQQIDTNFLQMIVDSLEVFKDNLNCIYITLFFIAKLLIVKDFKDFFMSKNINSYALSMLSSDNNDVSLNSLRIIAILMEYILKNNISIDFDFLNNQLIENKDKSNKHEYLVLCTLYPIVNFSDFSQFFEIIVGDILCYIPKDDTDENTLELVAKIILSIIKKNFGYFGYIHYRLGITSVLFEQLDECTVSTNQITFPVPILEILLYVIDNINNTAESIKIVSMISYPKYYSLIVESVVEVAELALHLLSFLVANKVENSLHFCRSNHMIQIVMKKFIEEAPFISKISGLKFLYAITQSIPTTEVLEILLSLNMIAKCAIFLDSDDYDNLLLFLSVINNIIRISILSGKKNYCQMVLNEFDFEVYNRIKEIMETEDEPQEISFLCHEIVQFFQLNQTPDL